MSLRVKTQPSAAVMTLAEAKSQLWVDYSDSDDLISAYINRACSAAETFMAATIMETVYVLTMDAFPSTIVLPIGPVFASGVVAITYVDNSGDTQTLASTEYQLSPGEVARIRPAYGKTWPSTQPQMDAVSIEFKAGYSAAESVPPAIRQAVAMQVAHYFANREAVAPNMSELPLGARNLLTPFINFA